MLAGLQNTHITFRQDTEHSSQMISTLQPEKVQRTKHSIMCFCLVLWKYKKKKRKSIN